MLKNLLIISMLVLASCKPAGQTIHGYVEGEFVMISPTSSGILQTLSVERGQQVKAAQALFSLDLTNLTSARDAAKADLESAKAQWDDLTKGKRPEEIEIILKQKEQAEAAFINAQKEYNRKIPLAKAGATSKADFDNSKAAFDSARAHVEEIAATLKTATLGAREDQLKAAKASIDVAQQNLDQAEKHLAEAAPVAPDDANIEDTFFRPGEYVAAGTPVVSLLPPENVKIRFFIPQAIVPKLKTGEPIEINCDGCKAPIKAKISFISNQAEYTPPVIYSAESRDKLVFMIEAKPDIPDSELRPGLPVDITLQVIP